MPKSKHLDPLMPKLEVGRPNIFQANTTPAKRISPNERHLGDVIPHNNIS